MRRTDAAGRLHGEEPQRCGDLRRNGGQLTNSAATPSTFRRSNLHSLFHVFEHVLARDGKCACLRHASAAGRRRDRAPGPPHRGRPFLYSASVSSANSNSASRRLGSRKAVGPSLLVGVRRSAAHPSCDLLAGMACDRQDQSAGIRRNDRIPTAKPAEECLLSSLERPQRRQIDQLVVSIPVFSERLPSQGANHAGERRSDSLWRFPRRERR